MRRKAGAASGRSCPETTKRRPGQVDRGRRTPREEERLGAPRSASATPARQRNRQQPPQAERCHAKAVKKQFVPGDRFHQWIWRRAARRIFRGHRLARLCREEKDIAPVRLLHGDHCRRITRSRVLGPD